MNRYEITFARTAKKELLDLPKHAGAKVLTAAPAPLLIEVFNFVLKYGKVKPCIMVGRRHSPRPVRDVV